MPSRTPQRELRTGSPAAVRSGYTLLELMLALTLAGFVLAAIGMAIDLHLRALDSRRTNVEEAEVARAVLRRMADDLRSAVAYTTIDFSSLEDLAIGVVPDDFDIDDLDGANDDPNAPPEDEPLGEDAPFGEMPEADPDAAGEEEMSLVSRVEPPPVVGVYGNRYELQIDISRLPRIDEYSATVSADGEVRNIPSDVKTVTWYLITGPRNYSGLDTTNPGAAPEMETTSSMFGSVGGTRPMSSQPEQIDPRTGLPYRGLVRRELDRAVTAWAATNGELPEIVLGEVLAPEVTQLEFRYFDGTQWLEEWDSEEIGGIPLAVEIAIAVEPSLLYRPAMLTGMLTGGSTETEEGHFIYRATVHLPAAKPIEQASEIPVEGEGAAAAEEVAP